MEGINQWLVELNKNSPVWFGVVTVLTMAIVGVLMAAIAEVILKIFGVKGEVVERFLSQPEN